MGEWLSYRAEDFLLFSEQVYWRLFERLNEALLPWPVLAAGLAAAGLALSLRRPRLAGAVLALLLGVALGVSAAVFVGDVYGAVNWLMPYAAWALAIEALGLGLLALRSDTVLRFSPLGYGLLAAGTVIWPLLAPLSGRTLASAEMLGVSPDATAVAVLGLLLCLPRSRWRGVLMVVPLLWLVQSALVLWMLSGTEALAPALAVLLALAGLVAQRKGIS